MKENHNIRWKRCTFVQSNTLYYTLTHPHTLLSPKNTHEFRAWKLMVESVFNLFIRNILVFCFPQADLNKNGTICWGVVEVVCSAVASSFTSQLIENIPHIYCDINLLYTEKMNTIWMCAWVCFYGWPSTIYILFINRLHLKSAPEFQQ